MSKTTDDAITTEEQEKLEAAKRVKEEARLEAARKAMEDYNNMTLFERMEARRKKETVDTITTEEVVEVSEGEEVEIEGDVTALIDATTRTTSNDEESTITDGNFLETIKQNDPKHLYGQSKIHRGTDAGYEVGLGNDANQFARIEFATGEKTTTLSAAVSVHDQYGNRVYFGDKSSELIRIKYEVGIDADGNPTGPEAKIVKSTFKPKNGKEVATDIALSDEEINALSSYQKKAIEGMKISGHLNGKNFSKNIAVNVDISPKTSQEKNQDNRRKDLRAQHIALVNLYQEARGKGLTFNIPNREMLEQITPRIQAIELEIAKDLYGFEPDTKKLSKNLHAQLAVQDEKLEEVRNYLKITPEERKDKNYRKIIRTYAKVHKQELEEIANKERGSDNKMQNLGELEIQVAKSVQSDVPTILKDAQIRYAALAYFKQLPIAPVDFDGNENKDHLINLHMRKWADQEMRKIENETLKFNLALNPIPKVLNGPDTDFFNMEEQIDILKEFNEERKKQESRIERAALKMLEKNKLYGYIAKEHLEEYPQENVEKRSSKEIDAIHNYAIQLEEVFKAEALMEKRNNKEFSTRKSILIADDGNYADKITEDNPDFDSRTEELKKLIRTKEYAEMTPQEKDDTTLYFFREKHKEAVQQGHVETDFVELVKYDEDPPPAAPIVPDAHPPEPTIEEMAQYRALERIEDQINNALQGEGEQEAAPKTQRVAILEAMKDKVARSKENLNLDADQIFDPQPDDYERDEITSKIILKDEDELDSSDNLYGELIDDKYEQYITTQSILNNPGQDKTFSSDALQQVRNELQNQSKTTVGSQNSEQEFELPPIDNDQPNSVTDDDDKKAVAANFSHVDNAQTRRESQNNGNGGRG